MDLQSWSTTAASNTALDGIDIAENCDPGNLNNAIRASMANVAGLRDLIGGAKTTGGSSNAYTLTTGFGLVIGTLPGMRLSFEANHTNTGAATLNVDGIGGKSLKRANGSALVSGDIVSGSIYDAIYEPGADIIMMLNPGASLSGVVTTGTPEAEQFARFTAAGVIEGRDPFDVRTDLSLRPNTDIQALSLDTDAALGEVRWCHYTGASVLNGAQVDHTELRLIVAAGGTQVDAGVQPGGGRWMNVSGSSLGSSHTYQKGHFRHVDPVGLP